MEILDKEAILVVANKSLVKIDVLVVDREILVMEEIEIQRNGKIRGYCTIVRRLDT